MRVAISTSVTATIHRYERGTINSPISIGRPKWTGSGTAFAVQIRKAIFCNTIEMPNPAMMMPMPANEMPPPSRVRRR